MIVDFVFTIIHLNPFFSHVRTPSAKAVWGNTRKKLGNTRKYLEVLGKNENTRKFRKKLENARKLTKILETTREYSKKP